MIREGRLLSVDAFRGATIALMVLVNNAGDGSNSYGQLKHSQWNGWTITDVVFPTFLFIVGISIQLAGLKPFAKVLRRSVVLFALGLFVYLFPHFHFETMRIMGVLQRIAICYLVASFLYRWSERTSWITACIFVLLLSYWLLMSTVPVPSYGVGRLDVQGNLAHYVDRMVLGKHNYASTKTWDPEGILSTLPAIATTLFGVIAGIILRSSHSLWQRTAQLFLIGNFLLAAGLICDQWLPINKKIWTSSFSLFMAGFSFVLLAVFIYFVELENLQRWFKPFIIFGRNAIAIYMFSELLAESLSEIDISGQSLQQWLYMGLFAPLTSPANASFLWALTFTFVMFLAAYGMYKRNWVIRV